MRRILLDESVPVGLTRLLTGFNVRSALEMGWAGITNGRLLDEAARAGFEVIVTADGNIRAAQRMGDARATTRKTADLKRCDAQIGSGV